MAFRTAPLLFVLCSTAAAQTTGFEGVAVDAITNEPLAGVHVRLVSLANISTGQFEAYGAMSDKAGRFSVAIPG